MARLTYREPQSGKIYFYTSDSEVLEKLAIYEDLDEKCIKEHGCDVYMIVQKYNEFLEHMHELAEFWELEKQGKLLKLPCSVGTPVFFINKCIAPSCELCGVYKFRDSCRPQHKAKIISCYFGYSMISNFGKLVFLTKEEAEAALENIK